MRAWKSLSLAFVAIGCAHAAPTSSPARPAAAPATAVAAAIVDSGCTEGRCAHPVDRVVLPRLKKLGLEAPAPEPNELCRRLAIDLLGRGPTEDERALCTTGKLEDTVDAWLARPEADKVERRFWFDLAQLEVGQAWYAHVLDVDALTGKMVKGDIGYGEFATRFVMHPALYARHPGADWIRAFYTIFLGRAARPDEVVALQPLAGVWAERAFLDGALRARYNPDEIPTHREVALNPCQCARIPGGCVSAALGKLVDFGEGAACDGSNAKLRTRGRNDVALDDFVQYRINAMAGGDGATMRLVDATAGLPRKCKGTKRAQAKCLDWDPGTNKPAAPLPLAPQEVQKHLRGLGEALTARRDFWEAEVDREMKRYLGWWQTTFVRPDSDLPELREALTDELMKTGSVRALRRAIVTSVLYTMPSGARAGKTAPPWASGPRKLLVAEPWLETMGIAVGDKLGSCDYRGLSNENYMTYVDPSLVVREKATIKSFDFTAEAAKIGGCTTEHRPTEPSLGLAQAERELAARLCGDGHGVVVKGADFEQTARTLVGRLLARPAPPEETARLANEMRECVAQGKKHGCGTPEAAARWMCVRLATSAEFGTY